MIVFVVAAAVAIVSIELKLGGPTHRLSSPHQLRRKVQFFATFILDEEKIEKEHAHVHHSHITHFRTVYIWFEFK